ncbi:MAG TPA: response regulator, partial [Bacteroidia bacterium]|nr:response regulator [Bacteroidia bacterium]
QVEMEKTALELGQQIDCLNNAAIVSITDAGGDIIYVNDTFCKISKYSREELIGKNHRLLKSGRQPDGLFVGMWKAVSIGRTWNGEILNKAKDGTFYWVDTTITPFRGLDGKIEKYVAIRFDITSMKNQKTEIEAVMSAIYRSNSAVEFDLDGNILKANDIFLEMMGYTENEILGKHHSMFVEKEFAGTKEYRDFWNALRKGKYQEDEFMRITKSGEPIWIKGNYNPILDSQGKPYKVLKIATDITLIRKQSMELAAQTEELEAQQEELRQSNEELMEKTILLEKSETELKSQQEELQQTNEELEEKANLLEEQKDSLENAKMDLENKARELEVAGKYKSEFLANMSHELRTPLNSILILAQLLSENKNNQLSEKEVDFARNIYNSGTDLLSLINEILDLSKVESGKMELDIINVPFSDISADISAMFTEVAKNKSIGFSIETDRKLAKDALSTDKQRLEQILRNLLSNAFKFTGKGGAVILTTGRPAAGTHFRNKTLGAKKDIIAFSVTDTGIGIPAEKQSIIFEAFQQADGSTKRKYGGTGLGLSISRELAATLGGEIHLQSEEGKGSTFTLYLPQQFDATLIRLVERNVEVRESVSGLPAKKPVERLPLLSSESSDDRYDIKENDRSVLIMEDDPDFAQVLLTFARERKYKGIIASEGNTGLSYARYYKPDAILLDMNLPVIDGADVLKQLKNDPSLRHVPVQIISGYDRRKEGLQLGAFDFLRKPISKDDLRNAFDKIEKFLSKKLKKLLIVEDNEKQNNAIRELVGNGDVKSFAAYSGSEAYRMMNSENFDCVIVDLGLPDMTGFDLLEKIKASDTLKKIPIIVYTGKDLTKEESVRLNKLANTVVLKTVDSNERLLDETTLFLHRVESRLPKEKQNIIRRLHKTDEVLKNKTVLVVDDDIRNIYSLTNVLEEEGINCLTAENGKAALKMLKEHPGIDIILMDVMMPEMDGYEATREIRNISRFSKLPIIALTAKAMKGDREKCLNAGMSDYITKPVNIEQLLSLMRVWLYR